MLEFLDATTLVRWQFAFTVSFHIIFPAFSIGLASYLEGPQPWVSADRPISKRCGPTPNYSHQSTSIRHHGRPADKGVVFDLTDDEIGDVAPGN